jgi:DNA-binding response OmpR family regulator
MTWLLVADDNDDVRELLAAALHTRGHVVRTAADGAEVVRILDNATEMPGVLILDLVMPRVTGRELLRAIRSLGRARRVPVIVVTGHDALSDEDIAALDVAVLLRKPVAIERLLAAVDQACWARSADS